MDGCTVWSRWRQVLQCTVVVLIVLAFFLTLDFSPRSPSYLDSRKVQRANLSSAETKNPQYRLRNGSLLIKSLSHSQKDRSPPADIKEDITPLPTGYNDSALTLPGRSPGGEYPLVKNSPLLVESDGTEMPIVRMNSSSFSGRHFQRPTTSRPDVLDGEHVNLTNSKERNEGQHIQETTYNYNYIDPSRREYNLLKRIRLFKMRAEETSLNFRGSSLDKKTLTSEDHEVLSNANQPNTDSTISYKNNNKRSDILSPMKLRPKFNGIGVTLSLQRNLVLIHSTAVDVASSKMIEFEKSNFDSTQHGQLFDSAQDRQLIESRILTHEQSVDKGRSNVDSILRIILLRPARTMLTKPHNHPTPRDAAAGNEISREDSDRNVRSDGQEVLVRTAAHHTTADDASQFSHSLTAGGAYDTVTHSTKLLLSYGTGGDDDKPVAYDSDGNVVECIPTPFVDCGEYAATTDDADHGVAEPMNTGSHGFATSGQREQSVKENVRLFNDDRDKLEAKDGRGEKKAEADKTPAGEVVVSEIFRARLYNEQTNVFIVIINSFMEGKKKTDSHRDGTYEL